MRGFQELIAVLDFGEVKDKDSLLGWPGEIRNAQNSLSVMFPPFVAHRGFDGPHLARES